MKLNPECIRDLLIDIESQTSSTKIYFLDLTSTPDNGILSKYTVDEVVYHARQCSMANLITKCELTLGLESLMISDLTPSGHEFLANIRTNSVWDKVKKISFTVGSQSLSALISIASSVVSELINNHFR